MNPPDSPRPVTPPNMSGESEEELRDFCDGFDEASVDRIVQAFGSLDELKTVFGLDPFVTEETLREAEVRMCWKNLLFKRLGGAPECRLALRAPATPVPPPSKTMTPRATRIAKAPRGLGFVGFLALVGAIIATAVALLPRDVLLGAVNAVAPAAQKALDVLAEGGQAVVEKATAILGAE